MTSDRGVIRQTHSMIWAPRWLTALVVALASSVLMVVTTPARAADGETELGATQLAAQTYPGVQLIQADFTSTISVPQAIIDEAAVNELYTRLVVQAATGAIGTAESQIIDAFVAELAKDPFRYVTPADARTTVEVGLSGFGTGFVVNAEGYLVTAAHVIAPDPDELKVEFARAGLRDLIANDLDEVQASGVAYSPANLDTLAQAFQDWYVRYLEVGEVSTTVSAQIGVATAGVDKTQRGQPAEIIKVGAPYPGKDVAVLKLDGAAHLPTLPLGDDADVPEGSTLHVTGYPAASTFSSGMSADSQVQPTITEGPLTAIKKTETGMPVFQTQAPASPGNSGGPVLDDAGNVVGILVASAVADDGTALEGQEFVIPISVVRQMLNETNVKPGESATTQAYNVALGAYFDKYYKRAMPEFRRVQALYPEHPYVADYITRTQQAIDAGKDETPNSLMLWVALAGGVLMVLAVGGVGGFLLLRKRGKGPAPAAGTAPQGGPWPGYPGPQGHQGIPGHQEIPGQQGYAGQPGFPGQQPPPGQPPQHAHQQPAPAGPMGQPAWPAQPQQPASHPPQPPVTQPLQPPLPSDPLPPPPWHAPGSAPGQQPPPGSPPPVP